MIIDNLGFDETPASPDLLLDEPLSGLGEDPMVEGDLVSDIVDMGETVPVDENDESTPI